MFLEFQCQYCQNVVSLRFLKIGERYMCKSCGAKGFVPESAKSVESATPIIPAPISPSLLPSYSPPITPQTSYLHVDYANRAHVQERQEPQAEVDHFPVSYKTGLLTVGIGIFVFQLLARFFADYHGSHDGLSDADYLLISDLFGSGWIIILAFYVIFDIQSHKVSVLKLLDFSFSKLKAFLPKVLLYFSVAAGFQIVVSLFVNEDELQLSKMSNVGIVVAFFSTVIVAPIFEEIIFRGYLYNVMRSKFRNKSERQLANAIAFAAAHVFLVMFILGAALPYYIFALGYYFAKLYEESDSVVPSIALHMLNNGLVFLLEILALHGISFMVF